MDTAPFAKRLEEEKARLELELGAVGRRNPENPADWEPMPPGDITPEADPIDAADFTIGFDTNASIVADLETRYNDVVAALARIASGTYGHCSVSGEPIEEERLAADPAAKTCLAHMGA